MSSGTDGDALLLFPDEGVDAPRCPQIEPVVRATLNAPVLPDVQLSAENEVQPVLTYKQRTIELTPKRDADGTWCCPYRIFDFRPTRWGYHKGCPEGTFASRHAAAAVSLKEAKRFVDSLDSHIKSRQTTRRLRILDCHRELPPHAAAFRIDNDSPSRIENDSASGDLI
jgi:hypothetical protein